MLDLLDGCVFGWWWCGVEELLEERGKGKGERGLGKDIGDIRVQGVEGYTVSVAL